MFHFPCEFTREIFFNATILLLELLLINMRNFVIKLQRNTFGIKHI